MWARLRRPGHERDEPPRVEGETTSAVGRSLRKDRKDSDEARRMAVQRDALRRVAIAVARGGSPADSFTTVARELGDLLRADYALINRYESNDAISTLAYWCAPDRPDLHLPIGRHVPMGEDTAAAKVRRTGAPDRRTTGAVTGQMGEWLRERGIAHVVAGPILVEERLWGVVCLMYGEGRPPPGETEAAMVDFIELVGCTIAQAESRAELIASRARLVAAADVARGRLERDLHDGAQHRLMRLELRLREAEDTVPPEQTELRRQLSDTVADLVRVAEELRQISQGLHPAMLGRSGLKAALEGLARRSMVPMDLHLQVETGRRLPDQIEVAVYFIVSEALSNVLKHANASMMSVDLTVEDETVRLTIQDDGVGGAEPSGGSGLNWINDRVEALGGRLRMSSPVQAGTSLVITIPLTDTRAVSGTRTPS